MKEKILVPQMRFPEFEGNWSSSKASSIFTINAGGDIDKQHVSNVKTEKFKYPIYANAKENKGFYAYSDIYKVPANVITVAGRGVYIGIAHARDHKFYPIVRLLVLKPKAELDIQFFEYEINQINLFIESTGVPQLTAPQFGGYKLFYPQYNEQQKIASFLTQVDKRIQLLQTKKEKLEEYKKGVMQKLFSQQIRFKDENGNPFPDWEEKKLGEVGETFNGLTGKTKVDFGEGKPYIQYTQIFKDSVIRQSECGLVKINEGEKQSKAQYGDVFFTTSSETPHEIGIASVLTTKIDEIYLNSCTLTTR